MIRQKYGDSVLGGCRIGVRKECIGGRGRNRTYNLSIKSRMLCQLSYASRMDVLRMGRKMTRLRRHLRKNITAHRGPLSLRRQLKRERQSARYQPRRLRKIDRLPIDHIDRPIALRQNILHREFQLQPVRR